MEFAVRTSPYIPYSSERFLRQFVSHFEWGAFASRWDALFALCSDAGHAAFREWHRFERATFINDVGVFQAAHLWSSSAWKSWCDGDQ
jgi:hypothetical protein